MIVFLAKFSIASIFFHSSSGINFSRKNETISFDNKMRADDVQSLESYEEMGNTNTLQLPPNGAQNRPNTAAQEMDVGRYAPGINSAAQPHVQMRGQMRQQGYPRPPSDPPEVIYECPN